MRISFRCLVSPTIQPYRHIYAHCQSFCILVCCFLVSRPCLDHSLAIQPHTLSPFNSVFFPAPWFINVHRRVSILSSSVDSFPPFVTLSCSSYAGAALFVCVALGLAATELKNANIIIGKLQERCNAGRNCHCHLAIDIN
jgi:hypothetical protein